MVVTEYLDEDGHPIKKTDDGIDRTVTVKDNQRNYFDRVMKVADTYGVTNDKEANSIISDHIDNENFNATKSTREKIGDVAQSHIGDTEWNYDVKKGSFPADVNKCNLFVYDALTEAGVNAPTTPGGWPLEAGKWGNSDSFIKGWVTLPAGVAPEKGDVAAYSFPYSDATGHTSIVNSSKTTVGTSGMFMQVNQSSLNFDGTASAPVVFKRYIGYSRGN